MRANRVQDQPAFLLHHRPFRDSSRLLDVLSADHGRLALVARGSRSAKSKHGGILRPFLPLRLSWVIRSDLGTLTGAELQGRPPALRGDSLLSAFYINELLVNFLHRHDPQPEIFRAYEATLEELAATPQPAAPLRRFEIALLGLLGYALTFDHEAGSLEAIEPAGHYEYRVEQGPVRVGRTEGAMVFRGSDLLAIGGQDFADLAVLRAAGRLLREAIRHHLGGREIKSRKVLRELHRVKLGSARNERPE